MNNGETLKLFKDGNETTASIVACLELENGKTYLLYSFENEDDVYASLMIEKENEIELLDVEEEDMELIENQINSLVKEEGV